MDMVDCLACIFAVLQEDFILSFVNMLEFLADLLSRHEQIDALDLS